MQNIGPAPVDRRPHGEEMPMRSLLKGGWLLAAGLVLSVGPAGTVELNPAALIYKLPDQIQWRDPLGTSGVNQAVLQGDPTKPGLYVVLNRFKPGNFSRPHFHPNDRFITVRSEERRVGKEW